MGYSTRGVSTLSADSARSHLGAEARSKLHPSSPTSKECSIVVDSSGGKVGSEEVSVPVRPEGDWHDGGMLVRASIRDQPIDIISSWSHCRCILCPGTRAVWALPPSDLAEMVAV